MNAARLDALVGRERCLQNYRCEAKRSLGKLPIRELNVRWRVNPRRYMGVENVGGPLVRPTLESAGKTRYISTTTSDIALVDAPDGIRPVKAAPVINVC